MGKVQMNVPQEWADSHMMVCMVTDEKPPQAMKVKGILSDMIAVVQIAGDKSKITSWQDEIMIGEHVYGVKQIFTSETMLSIESKMNGQGRLKVDGYYVHLKCHRFEVAQGMYALMQQRIVELKRREQQHLEKRGPLL